MSVEHTVLINLVGVMCFWIDFLSKCLLNGFVLTEYMLFDSSSFTCFVDEIFHGLYKVKSIFIVSHCIISWPRKYSSHTYNGIANKSM